MTTRIYKLWFLGFKSLEQFQYVSRVAPKAASVFPQIEVLCLLAGGCSCLSSAQLYTNQYRKWFHVLHDASRDCVSAVTRITCDVRIMSTSNCVSSGRSSQRAILIHKAGLVKACVIDVRLLVPRTTSLLDRAAPAITIKESLVWRKHTSQLLFLLYGTAALTLFLITSGKFPSYS